MFWIEHEPGGFEHGYTKQRFFIFAGKDDGRTGRFAHDFDHPKADFKLLPPSIGQFV